MDPKALLQKGRGGQMNSSAMKQVASMFDPRMLQKMGGECDPSSMLTRAGAVCERTLTLAVVAGSGMGGLQNMMKKFAAGGMPGALPALLAWFVPASG